METWWNTQVTNVLDERSWNDLDAKEQASARLVWAVDHPTPAAFVEPIMVRNDDRYCLFPLEHPKLLDMYKEQLSKFWTVEEIDFSKDRESWDTMPPSEQRVVALTLAFFANSDNIVMENLSASFMRDLCYPEAQMFLYAQGCMETIHVETYNLSIDTVLRNTEEKLALFSAIKTNPVVQPKTAWAKKWTVSRDSLAHRLVAWAAIEGIFFSSSFAILLWLRTQGKLPGICNSNEKIIEDEALHVRFSAFVYTSLERQLPDAEVYALIEEAVQIEHAFVDSCLYIPLKGMNSTLMKQHVCKQADVVLRLLGLDPVYKVQTPFEWMAAIGLLGKSNFFEKRTAEYNKTGIEVQIRTVQIPALGSGLGLTHVNQP